MILESYILEIVSDEEWPRDTAGDEWMRRDQRVLADLPAALEELVENLNDLLPNGYQAQIGVRNE